MNRKREAMNIKKLCLAMAAAGLCASVANAGHMGEDVMLPAAPPTVNVTIPQYQGSWMLALEAKNQQQNNGDFHYAATSDSQANVPVNLMTQTDRKVHAVDPEHSWGWGFELGYNFEGNGRDVRVNWTHLHDSESEHTDRLSGATLFGAGFSSSDDGLFNMATAPQDIGSDWDEVHADSRNDYDHIDLVFGQSMDFGQKVTLRAFGGLRYADVDNRDKATYRVTSLDDSQEIAEVRLKSDFSGLGPRAGIDGKVRLGSGFSFVGTIAGSLLAGSFDQKFTVDQRTLTTLGAVASGTFDQHKVSGKHRVVPELDARLGVNYTHGFSPDTSFGIEVGYEVINYFDVKDTSFVSYFDSQGHNNDFGMNGLYIRAQLEVA
jgi:hypothetical protein